jgi:hypothetical protein
LFLFITSFKLPRMNFSRQHRKPIFSLWIIMMSIMLLCAQNLQFHVHNLDHPPSPQQHDSEVEMHSGEHGQSAMKHLSIDSSHADHHDLLVVEMDARPDTILKQLFRNGLSVALFALIFSLLILGIYTQYVPRTRRRTIFVPIRRFHLFPLLRAPPLPPLSGYLSIS